MQRTLKKYLLHQHIAIRLVPLVLLLKSAFHQIFAIAHLLVFPTFKVTLFKDETGLTGKAVHNPVNLPQPCFPLSLILVHGFHFHSQEIILILTFYNLMAQMVHTTIPYTPKQVSVQVLIAQPFIVHPQFAEYITHYITRHLGIFDPIARRVVESVVILPEQSLKLLFESMSIV